MRDARKTSAAALWLGLLVLASAVQLSGGSARRLLAGGGPAAGGEAGLSWGDLQASLPPMCKVRTLAEPVPASLLAPMCQVPGLCVS